jgi:hypothetical protein
VGRGKEMLTEAPFSSSRSILGLVVLQGYNSIHGTASIRVAGGQFAARGLDLWRGGKIDVAQENARFWRGGGSFWRARLGGERSRRAEGKVLAGEGGGARDPVCCVAGDDAFYNALMPVGSTPVPSLGTGWRRRLRRRRAAHR